MGGSWSRLKWSGPGKGVQGPSEGATGVSASSKELLEKGPVLSGYTCGVSSPERPVMMADGKRGFVFCSRKSLFDIFFPTFRAKFSSYFSKLSNLASHANGNQTSIKQCIWPQDQSRVENRNHIDMSTNGTWIGQNTIPLGHVHGRPRSQLGLRGYRSCSRRTVQSFGSRSRVIKWSMDAE